VGLGWVGSILGKNIIWSNQT